MPTNTEQEPAVREYLLGTLEERSQVPIEDRLFTDQSFLEKVEIIEDELIDDYLRDRLSSEDRERFKEKFLVTEDRRAKLSFSNLLNDYVDRHPVNKGPARSSWWQSILAVLTTPKFAFAAVSVVLLIALGGMYLRQQRVNNELANKSEPAASSTSPALNKTSPDFTQPPSNEQAQKPDPQQQQPSSPPAKGPQRLQPVLAAFQTPILSIGASRAEGGMQQVDVPRDAPAVDINLRLPSTDYKRFKATLMNDKYQAVQNRDISPVKTAAPDVLVFPIKSNLIPSGEYQIRLSGISGGATERIGSYSFRIRRL